MFSHVMIGSNDLDRSRKFYDALLGSIGAGPAIMDDKGRLVYIHNGGILVITNPINGESATTGNGGTIGFAMTGPTQTDAWHQAGVTNGGSSIEDPPGVRKNDTGDLYLAYLRDPDGHKLCGLYQIPR